MHSQHETEAAYQRAAFVARESYGRLVAYLATRWGDLAAAEDALSAAFVAALERWPTAGVPERPESWLLTVARRKLIVDEAHNVAPSGVGRYAVDSQRTAAIRLIAPHFEHRLFLTATPHNGYAESFTALLELLDPQRFARGIPPDRQALMQVMVRRLKSDIPNWDGSPRFPRRELHALDVADTEDERQAHRWLHQYTELRQQNHTDHVERTATEFVLKLLKKRLLSSPAAFLTTLQQIKHRIDERSTEMP